MKLCVFFIFKLCPWIIEIGDWALRWTEGDERVQIFFVMLFFPLVMNALQYYIIDSFIKSKKPSDHEPIPSDDGSEAEEEGFANSRRSIEQVEEIDGTKDVENTGHPLEMRAQGEHSSQHHPADDRRADQAREEYDPILDGAASGSKSTGEARESHDG